MGVVSNLTQRFLDYTVGNGRPAYRTNPQTGQKYSFAELAQKAQHTQQVYQVNPYLAQDKPAIYA